MYRHHQQCISDVNGNDLKMATKGATQKKINTNLSLSCHNLTGKTFYNVGQQQQLQPEDFREMHLMPNMADFLSTTDATTYHRLKANSTTRPYPDVATYLETHLRLLWADFIEPLRLSVSAFCRERNSPMPKHLAGINERKQPIHIYRHVTFRPHSFLSGVTVPERPDAWRRYHIQLDRKFASSQDWEKSKRLIHGALVLLWNDPPIGTGIGGKMQKKTSTTAILATVANSDPEELLQGWLTLAVQHVISGPETEDGIGHFDHLTYTMLECDIFYEPYRAVMEAYQKMDDTTLPFREYLLGNKKHPDIPDYLRPAGPKFGLPDYHIKTAGGESIAVANVLNIDKWPSADRLGLNGIQRTALHAALTRKMALIQGPPGTGKTFIGRQIIATLLENKLLWQDEGNFLLDNARLMQKMAAENKKKMEDFWQSNGGNWKDQRCPIVVVCLTNQALDQFMEGVLKCTQNIIRIGSQSQSTALYSYLFTLVKENVQQCAKTYKESAYLYHRYKMNGFRKCIEDTVGELRRLNNQLTRMRTRRLGQERDLAAETRILLKMSAEETMFREQIDIYSKMKVESEAALCRVVDVIGLTTTGAARRRDLLNLLRPKIVLVEEAAQVLEPHIVSSLTTSCQHLIMIGDHQQLRPLCNVHKLASKYKMDVSLFERLIMNGVPSVMLAVQHRMRPEVCRLIVPSVYRNLTNHASVMNYPAVPSMERNVFFLDHQHPEAQELGGSSYFNSHESEMALKLAHFLTEQGILPEKITILVAYAAQMRLMTSERTQKYTLRSLDRVHITTIDNYQGEENDIVILSLVRNNIKKIAGFLKTANRVCVALSRARHGLYLLGNMTLLAGSKSTLWNHAQQVLNQNKEIGRQIVLRCDRHPSEIIKVSNPADFPMCGIVCKRKCGVPLPCGHGCSMPCRNGCSHIESLCRETTPLLLPCGHTHKIPCRGGATADTPSDLPTECTAPYCLKKLPCGHPCPLKCREPCRNAVCRAPIEKTSAKCQHETPMLCHMTPGGGDGCIQRCQKILPCQHQCRGLCGRCQSTGIHEPCPDPCFRRLVCGHFCPATCGQPCPPCLKPCRRRCLHQVCTLTCSRPCPPCQQICDWRCQHVQCRRHQCHEDCNRKPCSEPCPEALSCGHPCPGYCGELCPPASVCPFCLSIPDASASGMDAVTAPGERYVYLRDCGHLIPSGQMEGTSDADQLNLLRPPSCPKCDRPVYLVRGRYADRVRHYYRQLADALTLYESDSCTNDQNLQKPVQDLSGGSNPNQTDGTIVSVSSVPTCRPLLNDARAILDDDSELKNENQDGGGLAADSSFESDASRSHRDGLDNNEDVAELPTVLLQRLSMTENEWKVCHTCGTIYSSIRHQSCPDGSHALSDNPLSKFICCDLL